MAPRRGGGSGGGSSVSSLEDSPWGQFTTLYGTGFQDAYIVARLVFQAIGVVGILAIIVAAMTFKKSHELNAKVFKWWAFWLSALALFVALAMQFIDGIMSEAVNSVQVIYYLIVTIIFESVNLAEISLLLTLYILLPYCTLHPSRTGQKPQIAKTLKNCHAILLSILAVLWLATLALRIQSQVEIVVGSPSIALYNSRVVGRILTAYSILYFFGSIEIVAWSLLSLIKKRTEHGRTTLYTLALIAAPLLFRSTYIMGYVIHVSLLRRRDNRRLRLATDIIYTLTTIIIYAGIVVIARYFSSRVSQTSANPTYDPNNQVWNNPNTPANAKPNMAVHESAPPPVYQQGKFQPTPSPIYNQPAPAQGQGNNQYTFPPQHTQYHQPYLQNQHMEPPYSVHHQQQPQQQPYPPQGYYTPQQQQHQHQPIRTAQSPPPMQGQMSPVMHSQQQHQPIRATQPPPPMQRQMSPVLQSPQQQQHRQAPSEVSGVTGSTELPSPVNMNGMHAR